MDSLEHKYEILYKEIDLIQGCINRMAQNSFMVKGWFLSLFAAALAVANSGYLSDRIYLFGLFLFLSVTFGSLDFYYTKLERLFRLKYRWVTRERLYGNTDYLFDLDPHNSNMRLRDASISNNYINVLWIYVASLVVSIAIFCVR